MRRMRWAMKRSDAAVSYSALRCGTQACGSLQSRPSIGHEMPVEAAADGKPAKITSHTMRDNRSPFFASIRIFRD